MNAETSNAAQDDWDRLLVVNFWPCFTRKRIRAVGAIVHSFVMVHGREVKVDRFPPLFMMRRYVSTFVCSQLPELADRLIDAEDGVDVEETIRWMRRANLQCTGKTRRLPRGDKNEFRNAGRHYVAARLEQAGYGAFCNGNTKLGGGSKRHTRCRMMR